MPILTYDLSWSTWLNSPFVTTSSTTQTVWYDWVGTTATASTTWSHMRVWADWIDSIPQRRLCGEVAAPSVADLRQRAEEAARRSVRHQAAEKQRRQAQEQADDRATRLLLQHLTPVQRDAFLAHKRFDVVARSGTVYRLRLGWAGNVEALDETGTPVRRYCIHPNVLVPQADNLLCQKLLLETSEERFLKIANMTPLYHRRPAVGAVA